MKAALLLGIIGFGLLQVAPAPYRLESRPVDVKLGVEADPAVPGPALHVLRRACLDCHSNQTRVPWYGRVAPASWLLAKDVTEARQAMNLSEWGTKSGPVRLAMTAAACEGARSGRMPKSQYLMLHPEAKLTPADSEALCAWSQSILASIVKNKKEKAVQGD